MIIDRSNREKSVQSLRHAAARVRGGVNVIIFPEGTRNQEAGLAEFKSGGFHLAIEAGVPVIPVSVCGSSRITPKGSLRIDGRRSQTHTLYDEALSTFEADDVYDQSDATGFIRLAALRLRTLGAKRISEGE